jgi:flavin reductase (DIM6/NTAB) family NADH-FMN oxidoreductase RutF
VQFHEISGGVWRGGSDVERLEFGLANANISHPHRRAIVAPLDFPSLFRTNGYFEMDYDPRSEPHNLAHDPTTCLVVPRPIGWITTLSPAGVVNLAPYSFFNMIASHPPFVMFASNTRKHSQLHAESGSEFVFNLATYDLRNEMNITGGDYPENVSEPDLAKLAMAPSRKVKPPRVARSPIALECVYAQTVKLFSGNGKKHNYEMVIGEVVNVHIDDAVIVDGLVDMARIRAIGRLGYRGDYTVVDNIFEMPRVASR